MAEKKTATKKVATKKAAAVKAAPAKKAPAKKACATKKTTAAEKTTAKVEAPKAPANAYVNGQSVGWRAGDVYQTLYAAKRSMTVAEIAKAAKLTEQEVLLGIGWLFKEGKVVGENVADIRLA